MMEESQRPLKVFLCHAHGDRDAVRDLYTRLKRDGVDAWLDKANLLPGQDWAIEIRKAVAQSDVVIVCLSKQFNQEGFRQKEVRIALEAADMKPPETIFIMPVRLEECEVPDSLSRWHWVNLFEKDGYRILHRALTVRAQQIDAMPLHKKSGTTRPIAKEVSQPIVPPPQVKEEKPAELKATSVIEKLPKQEPQPVPASNTDVGRNVADSVIVTGNHNVINLTPAPVQREEKKLEPPKPNVEKRVEPKKPKASPKLSAPVWIAIIGLVGTICAALIGSPYIYNLLTNKPAPTATQIFTAVPSATFTPEPPTDIPTETFVPTATIIPTPTLGIGSTWTSPTDGMVMVYVPAGSFTMGSNDFTDAPVHTVSLDAFWIDRTDVTNAMYAKCVSSGGCTPPHSTGSATHSDYYVNSLYADYPVINVDWNQSKAYCQWRGNGSRLPTEAEWEKAARGTDGRTYPWGNSAPDNTLLNYNQAVGDTTEVGKYPNGASPYGALDMAGNVWQWVNDWYDAYPGDTTSNPDYGTKYRVLRGGSWDNIENNVRSAHRSLAQSR